MTTLPDAPANSVSREAVMRIIDRMAEVDAQSLALYTHLFPQLHDAVAALPLSPEVAALEREKAVALGLVEGQALVVKQLEAEIATLTAGVAELEARNAKQTAALTRLRDCDWVITLPDRMDAVREIAREALLTAQEPTDAAI